LAKTARAFNTAATWVAQVCWDENITNSDMLPMRKRWGFSVLRGSLHHRSPKGLPGPFSVSGGVMVTMK